MVTSETAFERGLVIGAFLPPRADHHALIREVGSRCAHLTIAVSDLPGQLPETHDRASWMQAIHLDADVVVLPDNCAWHGAAPCIETCASAWAEQLELKPDLDAIEGLSAEREALWARLERSSFLTRDEKRAAVGYGPLANGDEVPFR